MFAIHYYQGKTLAAVEGPAETRRQAESYITNRKHYLDLEPRIVSMNALRKTDGPEVAICCTIAPRGIPCACGSGHIRH